MKLVRDPGHPALQVVRDLQALFCRLEGQVLAARDPAWIARIIEQARSGLQAHHQAALADLPDEEAASLQQRSVDGSLVMKGYALARELAPGMDSPLDLVELFDLWDETQAGLERAGEDFDHSELELVMATALHRSHNARTFRADPGGPHIVLFQDRLLQLLNELAAVAVLTLPADERCFRLVHGRRELPEPLPEITPEGMADLRQALHLLLSRHAGQQWDLPAQTLTRIEDARGDLAFDLYQGMKFFVMGHEMAHITLKHDTFSRAALALREDAAPPRLVQESLRAHRDELEADLVGLHIGMCSAAANGLALHTYFVAVLLFFGAWRGSIRPGASAGWAEFTRRPGHQGAGPWCETLTRHSTPGHEPWTSSSWRCETGAASRLTTSRG